MGSVTLKAIKNDRGENTPLDKQVFGTRPGRTFMKRIRLRVVGGALLSGLVAVAAQAEVKLPVPAVDQSAVAQRGYFYVGRPDVCEPGKEIMPGPVYVDGLGPET